MNIGKKGKSGEDRVSSYLRKKGYAVVKRNYQSRFGEIDIIAETDEYIIFVEVKTRSENALVSGEAAVDFFKQKRMIKTAEEFIYKTNCTLQPRFDVAVVTITEKQGKESFSLKYIENAF